MSKPSKIPVDSNALPSIPNLLTLSRIALIPIIMAAFYTDNHLGRWVAALAFISACFTDFLDGYVARLWSQTSRFGQLLDPIADKLLVASTLLMLVGFGRIRPVSFLPALIILCREILVSGLREFLSGLQVQMPVTLLAKWKTAAQMIAISLLLIGDISPFGGAVNLIGEGLLWVAAILTLMTGYAYLRLSLRHL
ncbi:MAG: CDP-diacylglycerol--glycerol-3-phosphate 3-phosphatidyltransferase [Alphaproteobacteria bacterium]|jgi:cardiolipin synthase|nr:CDP-diacylglycerol--glycerol-3-phosphate 3-phosphatidyltransferase [Alphaproteobacteria bacterium]MDF3033679.1 CDP-diacylglycerol--glycerol-3-phosphate 3-phosphatidyltransferase [Alphaproteobacteria bacterium]